MSKVVNDEYPGKTKPVSDEQLKNLAKAQYSAEQAAETTPVKKDFPKLFKRVTTKGMKGGGKVVKMRGGGMASRGLNFRVR